MDNNEANQRRTVVPRWRLFRSTPSAEFSSSKPHKTSNALHGRRALFERILAEWKADPSIVNAVEVADAVSLFGVDPRAREAVRQVDAFRKIANSGLAGDAKKPDAATYVKSTIHSLKTRLIAQPRDAIGYVDLARNYTTIGQPKQAETAMRKALAIAPNNRFVLRSASRLYCHQGDIEQAYDILRRSEAVREDPWIMSAEVAMGDLLDKTPRFGTKALNSLASAKSTSRNFSELASALGTLESKSGSHKRAKKLIARSLDNPTENALAQAFWMKRDLQLSLPQLPTQLTSSGAYEASVMQAVGQENFYYADNGAWLWLDDEPFSVRAALHGSFINSSARRHYERALDFIEHGLIANPIDHGLINNKVFSLLQLGRLDEAYLLMPKPYRSEKGTTRRVFDLALNGLCSFKEGDFEGGRFYYERAIDEARTFNPRLGFRASMHWLEQEISADQVGYLEGMIFIEKMDAATTKFAAKYKPEAQTWKAVRDELLLRLESKSPSATASDPTHAIRAEHLDWLHLDGAND